MRLIGLASFPTLLDAVEVQNPASGTMRRRELIAIAGTGLVAWPLVARAQQQARIARLGYLGFGSPANAATVIRVEALARCCALCADSRGRANRRVGLCERVLRVAPVPEPQGGRGGGGAHADAVPEWRRAPGTRDQQGGKSAYPGGRHRDGLVLVAVSAAQPPEPMVSGALRPRWDTSP